MWTIPPRGRFLALLVLFPLTAWTAPDPQARALFDGTTLGGWKGNPASWAVVEGAIRGDIPAGKNLDHNEFLFHEQVVLRDFVLDLDYRITGGPSANSGIQIRCEPHGTGAAGYQADLDDGAEWLGRIYDEEGRALITERGTTVTIDAAGQRFVQTWAAPQSFRAVPRAGEWNHYQVSAIGPRFELRVNGRLMSILEDREVGQADLSGKLALQLHAGPGPARIEFKNIQLRQLEGASVAPAPPGVGSAVPLLGEVPPGSNLDLEKGTLEGWTVEGDGWKGQPVEGDTVAPRRPGQRSAHEGKFWIGGYERALDAGTGTLTSAPFKVTQPWGSFLVGGGSSAATRVELLEQPSGRVFFQTGGRDLETMSRVTVDLRGLAGKEISVRLVDSSTGPWGHLNFDDFRLGAEPPRGNLPDRVDVSPVLRHLIQNRTVAGEVPTDGTQAFWAPPGFRVDLLAKEPTVTQPVAFTLDERGRLWIVEAHSYPQKRPQGLDRVIILEDSDGDGAYETKKVFAEGINLASGIEVGFGGVFIGAAPELLFFPDRNRDDRPDGPPEVLLDGWGFQDTHETLNSFHWGPDGWLYGNQGVFNASLVGKPGAAEKDRVSLHACVWRYQPVTREFEVFAHGGSNQWGLDHDELGHLFMTHCRSAWGEGGTTYVVRGGHYWNQSNSNHAPFICAGGPGYEARGNLPLKNFLLASARYDHGEGGAGKPGSDVIYGGHSHVGTMIYLGDNWPPSYRGQLFTHNLHGHQMNRQVNVPDGSGHDTLHAGTDQLYCADPQYMAVDLQYGPDGSVIIIDWTDRQHCHHTTIEQWDRSNGRVFRMLWSNGWRPVKVDLGARSDAELAELLGHSNAWYSRTARRLLQERAAAGKLAPAVKDSLRSAALASATTPLALERLWAAHVTGSLGEGDLEKLLATSDSQVRAWAVTLLTDHAPAAATGARLAQLARTEASPVVRLALATAIGRGSPELAWALAGALSARGEDARDRWIPGLVWYGLASHVPGAEARALALAGASRLPLVSDSIIWFLSLGSAGRDVIAGALANGPAAAGGAARERLVELLAFALEGRGVAAPPAGWAALEPRLSASASPKEAAALERLLLSFGDERALVRLRAQAADAGASLEKRRGAIRALAQAGDARGLEVFLGLLDDAALRRDVIPLVARFGDEGAGRRLAALLEAAPAADQPLLTSALASKAPLARVLVEAIEKGRLERTVITALQARQIATLGDADLTRRLEKVWGKVKSSSAEARAAVARYRKIYAEAPLWAHEAREGEQVFVKVCAPCHSMNKKGGNIGPDLAGSARNGADYFIENIVDPHSVVGEAFLQNVLVLKDGTVLSGMASVTGDRLIIQAANTPPRTVAPEEIAERQVTDQSVMPSGLLDTLTPKDFIDLIKYLTTAG